jgi:aspartate racemase
MSENKQCETMKTIGLVGGMSWESSSEYYRIINETVKHELGGLHSAKCLMYSVDFQEVEALMHQDRWDDVARLISGPAIKLEKAGADCLVICTNTVHKVADEIQSSISIPLLHIADATAQAIQSFGLKKVGLLGTRFTMEDGFYQKRLYEKFDVEVIIPNENQRALIHGHIFNELCVGVFKAETRSSLREIMQKLIKNGAEGIILGCTELPLIIRDEDCPMPLFDTTRLHSQYAVKFCLEES